MSRGIEPLLLGPANSVAATGAPWRWVRDTAQALGVRAVGHGRKRFVPAAEFLEALRRSASEAAPEDPAEAVRRLIGGP